jgi:hypothetical protein
VRRRVGPSHFTLFSEITEFTPPGLTFSRYISRHPGAILHTYPLTHSHPPTPVVPEPTTTFECCLRPPPPPPKGRPPRPPVCGWVHLEVGVECIGGRGGREGLPRARASLSKARLQYEPNLARLGLSLHEQAPNTTPRDCKSPSNLKTHLPTPPANPRRFLLVFPSSSSQLRRLPVAVLRLAPSRSRLLTPLLLLLTSLASMLRRLFRP